MEGLDSEDIVEETEEEREEVETDWEIVNRNITVEKLAAFEWLERGAPALAGDEE